MIYLKVIKILELLSEKIETNKDSIEETCNLSDSNKKQTENNTIEINNLINSVNELRYLLNNLTFRFETYLNSTITTTTLSTTTSTTTTTTNTNFSNYNTSSMFLVYNRSSTNHSFIRDRVEHNSDEEIYGNHENEYSNVPFDTNHLYYIIPTTILSIIGFIYHLYQRKIKIQNQRQVNVTREPLSKNSSIHKKDSDNNNINIEPQKTVNL